MVHFQLDDASTDIMFILSQQQKNTILTNE